MRGPIQDIPKEFLEKYPVKLGRKPDFVIGEFSNPYLFRWWVIPRNKIFNIYLHQIIRDDDDRALHDHPWVNVSIVLSGILREVMPNRKRILKRFCPYFRRATAQHRLELVKGFEVVPDRPGFAKITYPAKPVWTLFLTGPKIRDWGFQCPEDSAAGGWRIWSDFVGKNSGEVGRGCGE